MLVLLLLSFVACCPARTEAGLPHRAAPVTCPAGERAATTPELEGSTSTGECDRHADCTEGANGRCVAEGNGYRTCLYDECTTSADCSSGAYCLCGEDPAVPGYATHTCVEGDCESDADCPVDQLCLHPQQSINDAPAHSVGPRCTTDQDECRSDEACTCRDEGEHCGWHERNERFICAETSWIAYD